MSRGRPAGVTLSSVGAGMLKCRLRQSKRVLAVTDLQALFPGLSKLLWH